MNLCTYVVNNVSKGSFREVQVGLRTWSQMVTRGEGSLMAPDKSCVKDYSLGQLLGYHRNENLIASVSCGVFMNGNTTRCQRGCGGTAPWPFQRQMTSAQTHKHTDARTHTTSTPRLASPPPTPTPTHTHPPTTLPCPTIQTDQQTQVPSGIIRYRYSFTHQFAPFFGQQIVLATTLIEILLL